MDVYETKKDMILNPCGGQERSLSIQSLGSMSRSRSVQNSMSIQSFKEPGWMCRKRRKIYLIPAERPL